MNYRELSEKLLSLLGGKDNILGNAACMTRLRISVRFKHCRYRSN